MSDAKTQAAAPPSSGHHRPLRAYATRRVADQPRCGPHRLVHRDAVVRTRLFIGAALLTSLWLMAVAAAVLCIALMPQAVVADNLDIIFGIPALTAGVITWTVSSALF